MVTNFEECPSFSSFKFLEVLSTFFWSFVHKKYFLHISKNVKIISIHKILKKLAFRVSTLFLKNPWLTKNISLWLFLTLIKWWPSSTKTFKWYWDYVTSERILKPTKISSTILHTTFLSILKYFSNCFFLSNLTF